MDKFYLFYDKKAKILNGCGQCKCICDDIENVIVNEEVFNDYAENPTKYLYENGQIVENTNYDNEQAELKRQYLKEDINYTLKTEYAYIGVIFTKDNKKIVFETNKESISLITMTLVALQSGLQTSVKNWKCRGLEEPHPPISVDFTSEQFFKLVNFAKSMVQKAFDTETALNAEIDKLTVDELLDVDYMKTFEEHMKTMYEEKVTRTIEV